METSHFEEFIAALNANQVKYLIIGAHAVAYHARPRATKDLDVFLEADPENSVRIIKAIKDFFYGKNPGFNESDFLDTEWTVQLGFPPNRIDLILKIDGISNFQEIWKNRVESKYGTVPCSYISLDDLIRNKEASNRIQDQADLRTLLKVRSRNRHEP